MENSNVTLTQIQLDALKEVGNIGAGNAATSFAQMVDREIKINIPSIELIALEEVSSITGSEEDHVAGILFKVDDEAPGTILIMFPEPTIEYLSKIILDKEIEAKNLGEMEVSLLKEIGNILSGSYLNAINSMTNLTMNQSIPGFSYDMAGAILSSTMLLASETGEDVLLIETEFVEDERIIDGYFFFIPEKKALDKILKSLGMNDHE